MNKKDIMVIGIAGGTGSGKSTITNRLVDKFGEDITVLTHDNYYKEHHDMPFEDRCLLNYDHPDSLDTDIMIDHIKQLKLGLPIECPVYDFAKHDRSDDIIVVKPSKVLIVEGILLFAYPELNKELDLKIFVDTDADVRILRRVKRDVRKRGRTLENVIEQYLTTVKPMHEQFVEPSKKFADIIVPHGGRNEKALEMITARVKAHIYGA